MLKLRPYKDCDAEYIAIKQQVFKSGRTYKLFYFRRKLGVY